MSYGVENIKKLTEKEKVRENIGMYIGSPDSKGTHHLAYEILSNSIDEALAGYCNKIQLTINADGSLTLEDNGRGIPVGYNEKGLSVIEEIFQTVHMGGKFDRQGYEYSGGKHGVGTTVTNYLSEYLEIEVKRDGFHYKLRFDDGDLTQKTTILRKTTETGTKITFKPSSTYLLETKWNYSILSNMLKKQHFLTKNLEYTIKELDSEGNILHQDTYLNSKGLAGYIDYVISENENIRKLGVTVNINDKIIEYTNSQSQKREKLKLSIAFQYTNQNKTQIVGYTNNINQPEGGTHVQGLRELIYISIKNVCEIANIKLPKDSIKDDFLNGIIGIVSINLSKPTLEGQTKNKLGDSFVQRLIPNELSKEVELILLQDLSNLQKIAEKIKTNTTTRKAIENIESAVLKKVKDPMSDPDCKLIDAESKDRTKCELFIVEGDSAGGGIDEMRNSQFQAIYKLKGKPLNSIITETQKIFDNKELKNLIYAIGTGIGKNFDITKLRYSKIFILSDADSDGGHIQTLLLGFLKKLMPQLFVNKIIYRIIPPLYGITTSKGSKVYLKDKKSLQEYEQAHQDEKYTVVRFKGLGEMNPEDLYETCIKSENRIIERILDTNENENEEFINSILGSEGSFKYDFLRTYQLREDIEKKKKSDKQIEEVARETMYDYGMYVNQDRAIPNLEDGLKPVHRRLLFSMNQLGIKSSGKTTKSARIVGDTVGKYHPHGDNSVYGASVKLTQEFYMKNPLILKQGNFGSLFGVNNFAACFTKDTEISIMDNRKKLTIGEIIEKVNKGEELYTYSFDILTRQYKPGRIIKGSCNGKRKIMKVILDNNQEIKCTENHKFLLHSGEYLEAQYLTPGMSLCPLYREKDKYGYEFVKDLDTGKKKYIYQLDRENLKNYEITTKVEKHPVIHHQDFDKDNNNTTNLIYLSFKEYGKIHNENYEKTLGSPDIKIKAYKNKIGKLITKQRAINLYKQGKKKLLKIDSEYYKEMGRKAAKKNWNTESYKDIMKEVSIKNGKYNSSIINQRPGTGKLKVLGKIENIFIENYKKTNNWNLSEETFNFISLSSNKKISYKTSLFHFNNSRTELLTYILEKCPKKLKKLNHKVKEIIFTNEYEDIYDIEVEKYHNFALEAGVIVHNSRYTEMKLSSFTEEILLQNLSEKTQIVPFKPTYDGTLIEPEYFPAILPMVLLIPSFGIGFGTSCDLPPHNLNEVIDATIGCIKEGTSFDPTKYILGPEFPVPNNEIISSQEEIQKIYQIGNGSFRYRAKIEFNQKENKVYIKTLPYGVEFDTIYKKLIELNKGEKRKTDGKKEKVEILPFNKSLKNEIKKIENFSGKAGKKNGQLINITITLNKNINFDIFKAKLYKLTELEKTISFRPILLDRHKRLKQYNLKEIITEFLVFRREVLTKQFNFKIDFLTKQKYINKVKVKVFDNIDFVIKTIRESDTDEIAKSLLIKKLNITSEGAEYILDLKLRQIKQIDKSEILKKITELSSDLVQYQNLLLLDNMNQYIIDELKGLKKKYNQKRETEIIGKQEVIINIDSGIDSYEDKEVTIFISKTGIIYKVSGRNTKVQNRREEFIDLYGLDKEIICNNKDKIYFIQEGKGYFFNVGEIKEETANPYNIYNDKLLLSRVNEIIFTSSDSDKDLFVFFNDNNVSRVLLKDVIKTTQGFLFSIKKIESYYITLVQSEELKKNANKYCFLRVTDEGLIVKHGLDQINSKKSIGVGMFLRGKTLYFDLLEDNKEYFINGSDKKIDLKFLKKKTRESKGDKFLGKLTSLTPVQEEFNLKLL